MTPYIDKIVVTIGSDNDLSSVQCQDKLHVGLGQFNSKIGIAAQYLNTLYLTKHYQEVKERMSLYFMWLTHHATGVHGTFPPMVWSQKSWMGYLFPLEWTDGLKMVTINISLNHQDTLTKHKKKIGLHSICGTHGLIIEAKRCKSIFISEMDHGHLWFRKWLVAYSAPSNHWTSDGLLLNGSLGILQWNLTKNTEIPTSKTC